MKIQKFPNYNGAFKNPVINGISFGLAAGESLAVVGESGSGKTTLMLSIMQFLSDKGRIEAGKIYFNGRNLLKTKLKQIQQIRGRDIGVIFQDTLTSLNPVYTVGSQLTEVIGKHFSLNKRAARLKAVKALKMVELRDAAAIFHMYPHQLSGGMRQRVLIALALVCNPKLIIADEPTASLDITIKGGVLNYMKRLRREGESAWIFITHDIGLAAEMCEKIIIMYNGYILEQGETDIVLNNPKHPCTINLLKCLPQYNMAKQRIHTIRDSKLMHGKDGCPFYCRCEDVLENCPGQRPVLKKNDGQQLVACFKYGSGIHPPSAGKGKYAAERHSPLAAK